MNATRIMWINGLLFLVVLVLSVMIITQERFLPGEPPVREVRREVTRLIAQTENDEDELRSEYKAFGEKNLFETIIPLPTPTPAPTRTPEPPPRIEQVTELWKLSLAFGTMASFQNVKTQRDFTLQVGESITEQYRGQNYRVTLESVDRQKFTATIKMDEMNEVQRRTFTMFD